MKLFLIISVIVAYELRRFVWDLIVSDYKQIEAEMFMGIQLAGVSMSEELMPLYKLFTKLVLGAIVLVFALCLYNVLHFLLN